MENEWKGPAPHPQWRVGDAVESPAGNLLSFDPASMTTAQVYKLMISAVVPRPIAFVSTVNETGVVNLAPFSYFNAVSSDPPCLVISITRKNDGSKKDTLINIERSRQFVVNTVGEWMAEPMNHCSGEFPFGVSELEAVGLHSIPSVAVAPPRVREAPVHFECDLERIVEIGEPKPGSSSLIIGRILRIHAIESAYDAAKGALRIDALQPLARLGGLSYGRTRRVFELPRPRLEPGR